MKEILNEYRNQKKIIDRKIQNLLALPDTYARNKALLLAEDVKYDLVVAIKELKKYVLE